MPNGNMSSYTKEQKDAIISSFIHGGRNAPPAPNARSYNSAMDSLINNPQKLNDIAKNLGFLSPDGDTEVGETDNGVDDQLNAMMGQTVANPKPITSTEVAPPPNQAPVAQQSAPKQLPPVAGIDGAINDSMGSDNTIPPMQTPQPSDGNGTVDAILAALGIGAGAYIGNKMINRQSTAPTTGNPPMTQSVPEQQMLSAPNKQQMLPAPPEQKMLPAPNKQLEYKPRPASPRRQITAPSDTGKPAIASPKPKVRVKAGGSGDILKTLAGKAGRMIR